MNQHFNFDGYRRINCPGLEQQAFEGTNQILMGLTHALSNILMPLREYPRLIQMKIPPDSPAVGLLSNMEIAADRLCELNNNLIQLCHGNEGTPTDVNLVSLLQQVVAEVTEQYPAEHPIRVEVKSVSTPPVVHGPHDAIYFAIRNVCVNAYEVMKGGGRLDVEIQPIDVTGDDTLAHLGVRAGSYIMLWIRDYGPGIPEHIRDSLFEPFVTTIRGEGRGLGLSQVYRTVRQLQGEILYCPDCHPGASFISLWPAKTSANQNAGTQEPVSWII